MAVMGTRCCYRNLFRLARCLRRNTNTTNFPNLDRHNHITISIARKMATPSAAQAPDFTGMANAFHTIGDNMLLCQNMQAAQVAQALETLTHTLAGFRQEMADFRRDTQERFEQLGKRFDQLETE